MRQIVIMAVMLLVLGGLGARYLDDRGKSASNTATAMTSPPEAASPPGRSRSVVLRRGNGGHFWTEARVDGRRIEFVVDTGATTIALRESDAARLGIHPAARE